MFSAMAPQYVYAAEKTAETPEQNLSAMKRALVGLWTSKADGGKRAIEITDINPDRTLEGRYGAQGAWNPVPFTDDEEGLGGTGSVVSENPLTVLVQFPSGSSYTLTVEGKELRGVYKYVGDNPRIPPSEEVTFKLFCLFC